jgi:amino acid adenylation domain-containing protein
MTANLPISRRQEAILVDHALFPGVPANQVLLRLSIPDGLNEARFLEAFATVVALHEAFRFTVTQTETGFQAQVNPVMPLPALAVVDLRASDDARAAENRWLDDFCRKPLDFGSLLWRAALLRLNDQHYVFYLDQHHVITDSQSCLLLVDALEKAYQAQPLPPVGSFTADLMGNAAYAASPAAAAAEEFWSKHLAGTPPSPRLYGRDPAAKGPLTYRVTQSVDSAFVKDLDGGRLGASPAQLLTAAFAGWMRRVGDSEDFVFGLPLLNRALTQTRTVGLLMEVCPFRMQATERDSFADLVARVKTEESACREPRRLVPHSRQARYDALLNVHPASPTHFAGLPLAYELTTPLNVIKAQLTADGAMPWFAREALTLHSHPIGADEGLQLSLDVNRGLFTEVQAKRALDHFITFLRQCLAHPDRPTGEHSILGLEELRLLLPEPTARDRALCAAGLVTAQVEASALRRPQDVAVRHRGHSTSYRELHERVLQLTATFIAAGVGAGDRVGVCLERSPDLVACLLAVLRTGAAYVPLDPHHPSDRLQLILEDATPRLLICDAAGAQALGAAAATALRLGQASHSAAAPHFADRARRDGAAYVIFTSGSTGRPKGVQVLHRGLAAFLEAMRAEPGCTANDRVLALTTISFDIAGLELFLPLCAGGVVVLADREDAVDPAAIERLMTAEEVSIVQATPTTYHMLIQNGWSMPQVKALVGGEALTAELAEALLPRVGALWNMYGPTETTIWSTCARIEAGMRPIPIGRAIAGTRAYVLNGSGQLNPLGVAGELHLGGLGVAAGYLARPELTTERFVADPFTTSTDGPSDPAPRMYRTGDVVRMRDDGCLEYIGRRDFQVKVRGYRIELGEIESVLEAHPSVAQAIAVVRGAGTEAAIIAYVTVSGEAASDEDLRSHLRSKLPGYMIPARIVRLEAFPQTPAGKVDRKALPEPPETADLPVSSTAQRSPFENRVLQMWRSVLGGGDYAREDNFFDVGGNSMHAIKLTRLMQNRLGVNLDVGAIFRAPTLGEQAQLAERGGESASSSVVTLQAKGKGPPIYGLYGIHIYSALAGQLPQTQPFHSVYVPGEAFPASSSDGGSVLELRLGIEEVAAACWERIKQHHGGGPLNLLGFCDGGLVAYEVACLAAESGVPVANVIMVEAGLLGAMRREGLSQILHWARRLLPAGWLPSRSPAVQPEIANQPNLIRDSARTYLPSRRFEGRCLLVRAQSSNLFKGWKDSTALGWQPWFGSSSRVIRIESGHRDILHAPAVNAVARELGPFLAAESN